jgi:hypothetical protein
MPSSPVFHVMVHAPGLQLDAMLRAEGLGELMSLIQQFRVEDGPRRMPGALAVGVGGGFRPMGLEGVGRRMGGEGEAMELSPEGAAAMARIGSLDWEALVARLPEKTFAMKLLLVTAWLQAQTGHPVFKGEVRTYFSRTGEPFPANPGRDTRTLIIDGLLLKSQDRQHLSLSEAGWKEAARALERGEGETGAVLAGG